MVAGSWHEVAFVLTFELSAMVAGGLKVVPDVFAMATTGLGVVFVVALQPPPMVIEPLPKYWISLE